MLSVRFYLFHWCDHRFGFFTFKCDESQFIGLCWKDVFLFFVLYGTNNNPEKCTNPNYWTSISADTEVVKQIEYQPDVTVPH